MYSLIFEVYSKETHKVESFCLLTSRFLRQVDPIESKHLGYCTTNTHVSTSTISLQRVLRFDIEMIAGWRVVTA